MKNAMRNTTVFLAVILMMTACMNQALSALEWQTESSPNAPDSVIAKHCEEINWNSNECAKFSINRR